MIYCRHINIELFDWYFEGICLHGFLGFLRQIQVIEPLKIPLLMRGGRSEPSFMQNTGVQKVTTIVMAQLTVINGFITIYNIQP